MDSSGQFARNLLILMFGLVMILFSKLDFISNHQVPANLLETLGIALVGYAPIQLWLNFQQLFQDWVSGATLTRVFRTAVRVKQIKPEMPLFFAIDISGLITPTDRGEIDLRRLQRLKSYCTFVKENPQYPMLVLFTGRSQGYVEMLGQVLGLLSMPIDIPHVIENGCALYRATAKRVIPLVNINELELLRKAQSMLSEKLPNNEMEPKAYMVTINTLDGETIGELREKVSRTLMEYDLRELLNLTSSATSVDLTPKGVTKLEALRRVLDYHGPKAKEKDLQNVVSLGDSVSDIEVLRATGQAYCPAEDVDLEVRNFVQSKFGKDHVIPYKDIDVVMNVIERECGLRVI